MAVELFTQDPDLGDLYAVNGIDKPIRWDGYAPGGFETAGMLAPVTNISLAGSGTGQIVGTYWAYLRFIDALDNVSNLSPISAEFAAQGVTRTITAATSSTPIVITSTAHGLSTGNWVKISGVGGLDSANGTWQITVLTANTFSLDDSVSDGIAVYTGGGTLISGIATITYSSVDIPTETKVVRRQILRNTDGEAITFYVDVDTTDLTSTTFTSTKIDDILGAGISVPLLGSDGLALANANDPPPSIYKCIAQQFDRMFMAGLLEYNIGSCSVSFGSVTIIGAGTHWKSTFAGRFIYIDGASKPYEIASVDESLQQLTLTSMYVDSSDLFAFYAIKPPPAYRRILQFSQAGSPQSWPAFNGVSIQETGDELTGLFQMGPFIYITERTHSHRFIFAKHPLVDGAIFMSAFRGAVNQRCIIVVDAVAYMLDELGCHRFKGNADTDPVSVMIQPLFRQEADNIYQINWHWKEFFHASLDRQRETIRWFVCLDGNRYPRHAIAFQYRANRWWIEEYPYPIAGTCVGYLGSFTSVPQVFYGGQHGKILAAWINTTDGVNPDEGDVRGRVSAATAFGFTDQASTWPQKGIINTGVSIVSGLGKGQSRRIVDVAGTSLVIDSPWSVVPDSTSVYQIGGIHWLFRSAWMRLSDSEAMADRRFEILFEPQLSAPVVADLRFFSDFTGNADLQAVNMSSDDGGGMSSIIGQADLTLDMTKQNGLIDRRLPGGREYFIQGKRWIQYELEGYSNEDQLRIYQMLYEGAKASE